MKPRLEEPVFVSFRVDSATARHFEKLARENDRSRSAEIRRALEAHLANQTALKQAS